MDRVKQEEMVEEETVAELVESKEFLAETNVIEKAFIEEKSKSGDHSNKTCESKTTSGLLEGNDYDFKLDISDQMAPTKTQTLRKRYSCSDCDYQHNHQSGVNSHFKLVHQKIPRPSRKAGLFKCNDCDFKSHNSDRISHHKKQHLGKRFSCSDCDYKHYFESKVKTHFKWVHLKVPRIRKGRMGGVNQCPVKSCEFTSIMECKENNHLLVVCEECKFSTNSTGSLEQHTRSVHEGIVYRCHLCEDYKANRQVSLKIHIDRVHLKVPKTKCTFDECTYETYDRLKRHIEIKHEGIIRFKCDFMNCSSASQTAKDLRRHMLVHTKEKSNKCTECSFCSPYAGAIKRHMKVHIE